jgi:hypothetical protein
MEVRRGACVPNSTSNLAALDERIPGGRTLDSRVTHTTVAVVPRNQCDCAIMSAGTPLT